MMKRDLEIFKEILISYTITQKLNISLILQLIQAKTEITFFMVGDCFLKYKANHWTPVIFNGLAKVALTLQNTYSFN